MENSAEKEGFPPSVEYNITPLGDSLRPVICRMHEWGETHRDEIVGGDEFAGRIISVSWNNNC